MKTILSSIFLFVILFFNAQNLQDTITLKRSLVEKEGISYYIYDKNDACLFTKLNKVSKKEELQRVCFGDLYESYLVSDKKKIEKIILRNAIKNIDNPKRFEEIIDSTKL
ncbi:hypothetical protein [Chryseobacterium terrae]|uniref:Uncharacterized protein n=1 Tax=Chryseobacterium terrae TaxID=3163299 RepID=A0ABW8Y7D9_9FLAO